MAPDNRLHHLTIREEPRRASNELVNLWTLDLDHKLWNQDKV